MWDGSEEDGDRNWGVWCSDQILIYQEGMIIGIKLRNYKRDLDEIKKKLYKAED